MNKQLKKIVTAMIINSINEKYDRVDNINQAVRHGLSVQDQRLVKSVFSRAMERRDWNLSHSVRG